MSTAMLLLAEDPPM